MDRRKRAAATAVEAARTTRASSKSPSRRSSRNRSPARTSSPARTKSSASQRRRGRNKANENDTASETDDSKSEILSKGLSVKLSPLDKEDIQKLVTRNRKTPTNTKVANISTDGDDEVASLTAKYLNNKQNAGENPTPSDLSAKRSYSRSISRSLIDEEWSQSDTSEKNDDPIYGNRITRSRSKTQKLLRREQSLSKDAAVEFGGSIGASLFIILLPILGFLTQHACSSGQCGFSYLQFEKLKSLKTYVNLETCVIYLGISWTIGVISVIPYLGRKRQLAQPTSVNESNKERYFNGFATLLTIIFGMCAVERFTDFTIFGAIYQNYDRICFVAFVYALILSIWLFVRSAFVPVEEWNPSAKSGRLISDLFMGRQLNPYWGQIMDVKLVHRRLSLILTLAFNCIFLTRSILRLPVRQKLVVENATLSNIDTITRFFDSYQYDTVSVFVSSLNVLYVIDALLYEHHLASSFELQSEGVGAHLLLQYAAFPIWTSILSKYACQFTIHGVPKWFLVLLFLIFAFGLTVKRFASELKYHLRVYPNSSRSLSYKTLPTFQGQRLLNDKYWSIVRHPNLLGEIICAASTLPLLYFRFAWPPVFAVLYVVLTILHRARRIDARMAQFYNSAYARYKTQAPYSLIPYVY